MLKLTKEELKSRLFIGSNSQLSIYYLVDKNVAFQGSGHLSDYLLPSSFPGLNL